MSLCANHETPKSSSPQKNPDGTFGPIPDDQPKPAQDSFFQTSSFFGKKGVDFLEEGGPTDHDRPPSSFIQSWAGNQFDRLPATKAYTWNRDEVDRVSILPPKCEADTANGGQVLNPECLRRSFFRFREIFGDWVEAVFGKSLYPLDYGAALIKEYAETAAKGNSTRAILATAKADSEKHSWIFDLAMYRSAGFLWAD